MSLEKIVLFCSKKVRNFRKHRIIKSNCFRRFSFFFTNFSVEMKNHTVQIRTGMQFSKRSNKKNLTILFKNTNVQTKLSTFQWFQKTSRKLATNDEDLKKKDHKNAVESDLHPDTNSWDFHAILCMKTNIRLNSTQLHAWKHNIHAFHTFPCIEPHGRK